VSKQRLTLIGLLIIGCGLLSAISCSDNPQPMGPRVGRRSAARQDSSAALIETVVKTLNNMPAEAVIDLVPPEPILDDSKSADQQPVMAVLGLNPRDPEGGYNYLSVPAGNANFSGLDVAAGDIVRYFAKYDEESAEHGGGEQVGYYEFPVRRRDTANPNNALVLDVSLAGPMDVPHRIEVWRYSDRRVREIRLDLENYIRRRDPAIGWEPSPDETSLSQLVDRANQWFRNLTAESANWKPAELLGSLPESIRTNKAIAPLIAPEALRDGQFTLAEMRSFEEAVWSRDISLWAKGAAYEKTDVAANLFDWVVRNIQLDAEGPGIVHQPWQALMYGHGTAKHRAWVFVELCRQQQLDAVILNFGDGDGSDKWLVALAADGELHLFDPRLGMWIPGTEPDKIATLSEVKANPELLRKLDVDDLVYPLSAEDLEKVTAQIVATPLQLSRRAESLQRIMQGEDYVVLIAEVDKLAESLKKTVGHSDAILWPFPYEERIAESTMRQPQRQAAAQRFLVFAQNPRLWKARTLHFQGNKPVPVAQQNDPLAEPRRGHREATQLYQHREVRPSEQFLSQLDELKRMIYTTAKADASYWLGLLSFDLGKYEVADDWFRTRTLAAFPNGPWTAGAQYNLARTLIELGKIDEAISILEADQSPQRHGNLILARTLKPAVEDEPATEPQDLDAEPAADGEPAEEE
jgi:tetratricopeptide (TPR) repeat protein